MNNKSEAKNCEVIEIYFGYLSKDSSKDGGKDGGSDCIDGSLLQSFENQGEYLL